MQSCSCNKGAPLVLAGRAQSVQLGQFCFLHMETGNGNGAVCTVAECGIWRVIGLAPLGSYRLALLTGWLSVCGLALLTGSLSLCGQSLSGLYVVGALYHLSYNIFHVLFCL